MSIYKHIRVKTSVQIGTDKVYKTIRIKSNVKIGIDYIFKKIRIATRITIDEKEYIYKRTRIKIETGILPRTIEWTYPKKGNIKVFITNPNIIIGTVPSFFTDNDFYRSGIGSFEYYDLKLIEYKDNVIKLQPGIFYKNNLEYYYLGDDYQIIELTGTTCTVPIYYLDNNYLYNDIYINQPIIIHTGSVTNLQYVETYNPSNNNNALRYIVNLSGVADTLDGYTDYVFVLPDNGFYIIPNNTNYDIVFSPSNTGTKYLYLNRGYITYELPSIIDYPGYINGFIVINDDKILITPNSISVYYQNIEYSIDDMLLLIIKIEGSRGEFCPNYPLIINDKIQTTTNKFGIAKIILAIESSYINIKTHGQPPSEFYDSNSYFINYNLQIAISESKKDI